MSNTALEQWSHKMEPEMGDAGLTAIVVGVAWSASLIELAEGGGNQVICC